MRSIFPRLVLALLTRVSDGEDNDRLHPLYCPEVQNLFASSGTVTSVSVVTDKYTGQSKGFGFVEMSTDAEADAAIRTLNGTMLGGRSLTVNEAKPREERSSGGYGGGGGNRGGGGGYGGGRDRDSNRGGGGSRW